MVECSRLFRMLFLEAKCRFCVDAAVTMHERDHVPTVFDGGSRRGGYRCVAASVDCHTGSDRWRPSGVSKTAPTTLLSSIMGELNQLCNRSKTPATAMHGLRRDSRSMMTWSGG